MILGQRGWHFLLDISKSHQISPTLDLGLVGHTYRLLAYTTPILAYARTGDGESHLSFFRAHAHLRGCGAVARGAAKFVARQEPCLAAPGSLSRTCPSGRVKLRIVDDENSSK